VARLSAGVHAARGLPVLVYSRWGYGHSDPIPPVPRQIDCNFWEAPEVLPARLRALGVECPVRLGHSDGNTIALVNAGSGLVLAPLGVNHHRRAPFVAVMMDKHSRRVVGWSFGPRKDVALTPRALDSAVRNRRPRSAVLFHSDRGTEYAASAFKERLAELGFTQSMNRPGKITDTAFIESFFHSMKSDSRSRRLGRANNQKVGASQLRSQRVSRRSPRQQWAKGAHLPARRAKILTAMR
jgi:transposase InsO family protein